MSDKWQYCGGELGRMAYRVYRKGSIGKVVRTRMGMTHMSPGHRTVRYFRWNEPEREYEREAEATK